MVEKAFRPNETFQDTWNNLDRLASGCSQPEKEWAMGIQEEMRARSWLSLNLTQYLFDQGRNYSSTLQCIQTEHNMAGWAI